MERITSIVVIVLSPVVALAAADGSSGSADSVGLVLSSGAVGALCGVVGAWVKARVARKVEVEAPLPIKQPLEVDLREQYVTRREFERHCTENEHDHENIFNRLTAADKSLGNIAGLLEGIRADLALIKGKLFQTKGGK